MQSARPLSPVGEVIVDYVSPDGPTVTHVRGGALVAALQVLKDASLYDAYLSHLPASSRETLTFALAASWLPVELVAPHLAAIDAIGLTERALADQGERIARQVGDSLFGTVLRAARGMGLESVWFVSGQVDRLLPRLYRGGGCYCAKLGPKDSYLEVTGIPMLESRFYRAYHNGFMRGIAQLLGRTCYVKVVRPRVLHPHSAATTFSWV